jgi:hypothetical protein
MSNPAKRKGDTAEREIATILNLLTGWPVRRKLGAGRADDTGDLDGIPDTTAQVKHYADVTRAVREGLDAVAVQQANAGTPHGVAFIRRPGGRWFSAMTVEQWATLAREALLDVDDNGPDAPAGGEWLNVGKVH